MSVLEESTRTNIINNFKNEFYSDKIMKIAVIAIDNAINNNYNYNECIIAGMATAEIMINYSNNIAINAGNIAAMLSKNGFNDESCIIGALAYSMNINNYDNDICIIGAITAAKAHNCYYNKDNVMLSAIISIICVSNNIAKDTAISTALMIAHIMNDNNSNELIDMDEDEVEQYAINNAIIKEYSRDQSIIAGNAAKYMYNNGYNINIAISASIAAAKAKTKGYTKKYALYAGIVAAEGIKMGYLKKISIIGAMRGLQNNIFKKDIILSGIEQINRLESVDINNIENPDNIYSCIKLNYSIKSFNVGKYIIDKYTNENIKKEYVIIAGMVAAETIKKGFDKNNAIIAAGLIIDHFTN